MEYILSLFTNSFVTLFANMSTYAYLWAPIVLMGVAVGMWVWYARLAFVASKPKTLIEIKMPKETYKSPLAMETALTVFHQTGRETNWYKKYFLGQMRPWFSLEIVSIEGNIRFFIWMEEGFKDVVAAQLYAQYPTIEIYDASDYTKNILYGENTDWKLFGTEYELSEPDPYPIKTYVDYGLDKDPKEEYKVDPLVNILEYLGQMRQGEQFWMQIIVRATKKTNKKPGGLFGKSQDWKQEGKDLAKELRKEFGAEPEKEGEFPRFLTKEETEIISAVERSTKKLGFDCGIRVAYLGKGDAFRGTNIAGIIGLLKQFNSNKLNGFQPGMNITDVSDYPGEDFWSMDGLVTRFMNLFNPYAPLGKDALVARKRVKLFNAYIRRGYFNPPYKRKWFVLNSEELATVFHFPGQVADTPTFARIDSKKGEPPANLPG